MAAIMAVGARGGGAKNVDNESDKLQMAIKEVFIMMHPNSNNEVERDDLNRGFHEAVNHKLTEDELDALMAEVDSDSGGTIDYDEFAAWMLSSSKLASELRHTVKTASLGGMSLDNMVDDLKVRIAERAASKQFIWKSDIGGLPHTIFVALEEPASSTVSLIFGTYMQLLIFLGSCIFIAESLESIKSDKDILSMFYFIEWFCIFNFTLDYLARVATCWTREGESQSVPGYLFEVRCVQTSGACV
jgi:hypothetical protein